MNMTKNDFNRLAHEMSAVYGVSLIYNEDIKDGPDGFICPHCEEPIYYEDWEYYSNLAKYCPICEERFELD